MLHIPMFIATYYIEHKDLYDYLTLLYITSKFMNIFYPVFLPIQLSLLCIQGTVLVYQYLYHTRPVSPTRIFTPIKYSFFYEYDEKAAQAA